MKKEKIDRETVMHVARLARLHLSKKEVKKYQKDMNEILKAFSEIKKVNTGRKASLNPLDVKDVMRKDEQEKSLPREAALGNTKHKEKGFFKGPKAV